MVQFDYVIKDEVGLHARPAGNLAKCAKACDSKVTVACNGKSADASKIMAVMSLGAKCGMTLTVTVEGASEAADAETIKAFLEENL